MALVQCNRNSAFDCIKCIAAFLVVCIHYAPINSFGDMYFNAICRVAVPLFFLVTGYYYDSMKESGKLKSYIIRIIKVTFFTSLFYLTVFTVTQYLDSNLTEWLSEVFSFKKIVMWLVFNEYPVVGHLWYLYALIYALIANVVADKCRAGNYLLYIAIATLILNIIINNVGYGAIYARNWALLGLPFVILGRMLYRKRDRIVEMNVRTWIFFLIVVVCLILLFFERLLLQRLDILFSDLYVCVIPIVLSVAVLAIKNPNFGEHSYLALVGKKYSSEIYVYHIFIGLGVLALLSKFSHISIQYFIPLIVFGTSLLFCVVVKYVKSNVSLWLQNLHNNACK